MQLESRDCTVCGIGVRKKLKYNARFHEKHLNPSIFSARRSPDQIHFRLVECEGCGIIFSDPAASVDTLSDLYQRSHVSYSGQEADIYRSYLPHLEEAAGLTTGRKAFVEVGGGRGFMLRFGHEHGFATQIEVEPSHEAAAAFTPAAPSEKFICEMFTDDLLEKNSVSLICFFQVLDHLPDPVAFLKQAYDALEPGGVALGIAHDTLAWSARLLGEKSPIYDIGHTYLFNRANVVKACKTAGFKSVYSRSISNTYSIAHWLNIAPLPKAFKAPIKRGLSAMSVAETKVRVKAGNLAVFAVK